MERTPRGRTPLAVACITALIGVAIQASAQAPSAPDAVGGAIAPSASATASASAAAPAPSASASGAATSEAAPAASSAAPAGSAAPAVSASATVPAYTPPAYSPPAYPTPAPPFLPPPPAGPDEGTTGSTAPRRQPRGSAEAGGIWAQGLDATDAATRQGGFYAGGSYSINEHFRVFGRYAFTSGTIIERLSGSRLDSFGTPNDVRVLQSRHAFNADVGYLMQSHEGRQRFWALPFLGPRMLVLVDDVAPRNAFEAELGARVGVWSSDAFEASAWLAWAPALAKTSNPGDVYGRVLSELRFGAGTAIALGGPFGVTLAYEGDVVTLAHQRLSYHQVLTGLTYAFE